MAAGAAAGRTVPGGPAQAQAAIARAAAATGIDFRYLLAQARLESRLDPTARGQTSSAAGLYQFTNGTWFETLARHGGAHGLGWARDAIASADPAHRAQVLALRYDPDASALMAAELAGDNRADLAALLGREPDPAELYLAHFLGIGGAKAFLSELASNPARSAASLLPRAAAANRAIFYAGDTPRSLAQMMDLIRGKVAGAMEGDAPWEPAGAWPPQVAMPGAPVEPRAGESRAEPPARLSMAETLQATFGAGESAGGGAASGQVGRVYARLARLGL